MDVDDDLIDHASEKSNSSEFLLWDCPVEGCIRQYRRYYDLQSHLDTGKHVLKKVKMPLLDKAKIIFQTLLENDNQRVPVRLQNFNTIVNTDGKWNVILSKGWALSSPRTNTRFTESQKQYLIDAYQDGENSGLKSNPETLSLMPFIKENSQFRFSPEECLTTSQIKSYFSCLTRQRRKKINDSQRSLNQSVTTITYNDSNSNESDEETDEDDSHDYDYDVAAEQMNDFEKIATQVLKR
ncbi:unnamed protein product [Rotaria sp. Silwood2]|nr:unnamed protein product [Rotaria sp. Silwood2]CAF4508185.1 unnamed protein product [Rotaria sp. Silwood2]